ncbi:MAG: hypothetical protein K9H25_06030 [Rhodospirillum sp.]|nr:hypothetical protein [Rhodospirillum sp.]MCF8491405.1 hypothetical protein [Rhodospirillum sp.]MCF8501294.1 hypothetical protein [Rhodospirillum sp.]
MSHQRKRDAVLRPPGGEDLEIDRPRAKIGEGLLAKDLLESEIDYHGEWIIQRHGYGTPARVRHEQIKPPALAA